MKIYLFDEFGRPILFYVQATRISLDKWFINKFYYTLFLNKQITKTT